jgi:Saxitoxin biosynthesis operon protein SxtJ
LSTAQLRNFGFLVGGLFAAWFGLLAPYVRHAHIPRWPWIIAVVLLMLAMLTPRALYYPYLAWARLGKALGWINSRIILNLTFFLIFAPAGIIARALGWDPLDRAFDPAARSYRIAMKPIPPVDLERPY